MQAHRLPPRVDVRRRVRLLPRPRRLPHGERHAPRLGRRAQEQHRAGALPTAPPLTHSSPLTLPLAAPPPRTDGLAPLAHHGPRGSARQARRLGRIDKGRRGPPDRVPQAPRLGARRLALAPRARVGPRCVSSLHSFSRVLLLRAPLRGTTPCDCFDLTRHAARAEQDLKNLSRRDTSVRI